MKRYFTLILLLFFSFVAGCGHKNTIDDDVIIVAASAAPHAEILEETRAYIESKGYTLKVKVFNEYQLQNDVTVSGEVDANFFQHQPYLDDYNANKKKDLVSVLKIHFEPLGIYQGRRKSLDDIEGAKIGIANDTANGARGLLLLAAQGIIKLNEEKGLNVSTADIIENKYNVKIEELSAAAIPSLLLDLDFAIINGNYALEANVPQNTLLAQEDKESAAADLYGNVLVVKREYRNKPAIQVLVDALKQDNIKNFIKQKYDGLIVSLLP